MARWERHNPATFAWPRRRESHLRSNQPGAKAVSTAHAARQLRASEHPAASFWPIARFFHIDGRPAWAYAPPAVGDSLRTLETGDGRVLAYAVWGDPDGFPVLALHGTPGCRLERWPHDELYAGLGVCLVTHDRAGYGQSTRRPGRRVVDEVDDVAALADELGFDRFGVTGGSGGGPHALACAALLPERVVRSACMVGVAPLGPPGLERDAWLDGMDAENVKEFRWAEAGEEVLAPELEAEYARMKERVAADPSSILADFELSESDQAQLKRPEMMQIIRESTFEHCANGVGGWVDDDLAILRPWGFDVGRISVPVLVRYGSSDVLVPPAHGDWIAANVAGCVVKIDDVAGHLGADPVGEITENMRWLVDGAPPAASRAA
jgi:pimeloyl-ACP methyl ester carboxylesterase